MSDDAKEIIATLVMTILFGALLFMGCMALVSFIGCATPLQIGR